MYVIYIFKIDSNSDLFFNLILEVPLKHLLVTVVPIARVVYYWRSENEI